MARQFGVRWPDGQITILRTRVRAHGYARAWQAGGIRAAAVTRLALKDWQDPWEVDVEGPRFSPRRPRTLVGGGSA